MDEYEPGSIRTYLMQMGDIPLLTRQEELATARQIARTRNRLRRGILNTDYALHAVMASFKEVLAGRLRLDQFIELFDQRQLPEAADVVPLASESATR